jgi:cell division protein FtsB
MQKMLIALGYLKPTWTSKRSGKEFPSDDGSFGSGTLKAVKAFQKAQGLKVDGLVGKNTIMAMRKVADRKERGEMDAKKAAGVGKAKQELDSLVKNVLDKRADTKIARMADEILKGKLRNPEMFDDLKALISAKGKVSGEEFGKLARAYINKDLAMYVNKLDFAGALDFMLQKTTIMPPGERKDVVQQIMTMRQGIKDVEKMTPDQAVAKHGTDKQKAKLDRLNKKSADLDKQINRIDNRTLDGVPVGSQAKKDFEKKVAPRTPYAMAKQGMAI